MKKFKTIILSALSAIMCMALVTPSAMCLDFQPKDFETINRKVLEVPSEKLVGNQKKISGIKEDKAKLKEINAYFANHQIYLVDFAEGNAFLNNDGISVAKSAGSVHRTAKFKFFKELGIITPVYGAIMAVKDNQGWTDEDLKAAMVEASSKKDSKYRIPVKLTEDAGIYAYEFSRAEVEDEKKAVKLGDDGERAVSKRDAVSLQEVFYPGTIDAKR